MPWAPWCLGWSLCLSGSQEETRVPSGDASPGSVQLEHPRDPGPGSWSAWAFIPECRLYHPSLHAWPRPSAKGSFSKPSERQRLLRTHDQRMAKGSTEDNRNGRCRDRRPLPLSWLPWVWLCATRGGNRAEGRSGGSFTMLASFRCGEADRAGNGWHPVVPHTGPGYGGALGLGGRQEERGVSLGQSLDCALPGKEQAWDWRVGLMDSSGLWGLSCPEGYCPLEYRSWTRDCSPPALWLGPAWPARCPQREVRGLRDMASPGGAAALQSAKPRRPESREHRQ